MKRMTRVLMVLCSLFLVVSFAQAGTESSGAVKTVPAKAEEVQPVLAGQIFPAAQLKGSDGSAVETGALLAGKPAVLIFYRGGW